MSDVFDEVLEEYKKCVARPSTLCVEREEFERMLEDANFFVNSGSTRDFRIAGMEVFIVDPLPKPMMPIDTVYVPTAIDFKDGRVEAKELS